MKILVIDDEPAVRYTLSRILESNGYEVIAARDGVLGLDAFRTHQPDLVITDLIMPEQEGIQTIQHLRQENPAIKILAISGGGRLVNIDFLQLASSFGADDVLAKPFDAQELLNAVHDLLAPRAEPAPPVRPFRGCSAQRAR